MRKLIRASWMVLVLSACQPAQNANSDRTPERPPKAGKPVDPVKTAARLAALRVASLAGDQAEAQRQVEGMHSDLMRSMKVPDGTRPIPREAARAAVKEVNGVQSAAWVDQNNLLIRVRGAEFRSHTMIDAVCMQLQPLGDTLGTVINLQDASARTGEGIATLSRDCQLASGDRAYLQQTRKVDVVDPEIRAQHRANQQHAKSPQHAPSRGDQEAINAIPEI